MAVDVVDAPTATDTAREDSAGSPTLVRLAPAQRWCGDFAVVAERFAPGVVGAKSLNTHALRVRCRALGPVSRSGRDTCIRRYWRCSAAALSREHAFPPGSPCVKPQSLSAMCHFVLRAAVCQETVVLSARPAAKPCISVGCQAARCSTGTPSVAAPDHSHEADVESHDLLLLAGCRAGCRHGCVCCRAPRCPLARSRRRSPTSATRMSALTLFARPASALVRLNWTPTRWLRCARPCCACARRPRCSASCSLRSPPKVRAVPLHFLPRSFVVRTLQ